MILTKMSLARTTISKRYCANGVVNLVYRPASLLSLSSSCQQSTPPRRFHSGERKTDDDNNNLSPAENLRLLLKEYNISMDNTSAKRKYSRQLKEYNHEANVYAQFLMQETYTDRITTEYIHRTTLNHGLYHNRIAKSEIKSIFDKHDKLRSLPTSRIAGNSSSIKASSTNNNESEYMKQQEELFKLLKL